MSLHVFHNDCDWVVAHDVDDAWAVWCETTGEKREDYEDDWEWDELKDDSHLTINFEDDDPDPGLHSGLERLPSKDSHWLFRCSTTCADWAERRGRGFLCSTEF